MLTRFLIAIGLYREERSFADVILNTRTTVSVAKVLGVCALVSFGLLYTMWIHPIFDDSDLGNSAIRTYLTSDYYSAALKSENEQLEEYNGGETEKLPPDLNLYFPVLGVIVKHKISIVPGLGHRPDGNAAYKIDNDFKVSLNIAQLILFSSLMSVLLIFGTYFLSRRAPAALVRLEELELSNHFSRKQPPPLTRDMLDVNSRLDVIFKRFNAFAVSLNNRDRGKPSFEINDEYDVQDLMFSILQMEFGVVKREVWGPDIAGSATRVDFQLVNEAVLIEIKKTRATLTDRQLSNELIIDIARYSAYNDIKSIIFFIYDPDELIRAPLLLLKDIEKLRREVDVKVFISPRWYE